MNDLEAAVRDFLSAVGYAQWRDDVTNVVAQRTEGFDHCLGTNNFKQLELALKRVEAAVGGVPLRQWYAGLAMQAIVGLGVSDNRVVAEHAFALADAMLKYEEPSVGEP